MFSVNKRIIKKRNDVDDVLCCFCRYQWHI